MVSQHHLKSFFHGIKCSGMTSFMEFMFYSRKITLNDIRLLLIECQQIFINYIDKPVLLDVDFRMAQWGYSFYPKQNINIARDLVV